MNKGAMLAGFAVGFIAGGLTLWGLYRAGRPALIAMIQRNVARHIETAGAGAGIVLPGGAGDFVGSPVAQALSDGLP